MLAILFNRQYSRHISQRNIWLIFHPQAQEIQIFFLRFIIPRILSEYTVPLVDNDYKFLISLTIYVLQYINKILPVKTVYVPVFPPDIPQKPLLQVIDHSVHCLCTVKKVKHIDMKDIIFIQICLKTLILCNLIISKHAFRIASFTIICHKHICSHRFSKTAWSA